MSYLRLFILLLLCSYGVAFSQQSNTLYYMDKVPQSNFVNPARQFKCKFYMGFPILSSIHLDVSNTGFSFNDITNNATGTYYFSPNQLLDKIHKLDMLSTEFHLNILAFGLRREGKYYSFSLTEKNEIYFNYPVDMMTFAMQGNGGFEQSGSLASFYKFGVNAFHYREYAFGISKKKDDYLTVGWKAKLLFGKGNVRTKADIGIRTRQDFHDLTVRSKTNLDVSGPITIPVDSGMIDFDNVDFDDSQSIMSIIFNRKNPGLSLDGGFIYDYDDRFSYSASYIDLGFIWWKSNTMNFAQDGEYTFQGLSEAEIASGASFVPTIINNIRDTFVLTSTKKSYLTMLPLKLHAGATYKLNKSIDMGFLARGLIYKLRMYPSLVFSANTNFAKFFTASLTYSFNNYSYNNLGLGFGIQGRHFQYYMVTDNFWGMIKPQGTRNANIRFGMNLFFGCHKKDKSEYKIGCPWFNLKQNDHSTKSPYLTGKLDKRR